MYAYVLVNSIYLVWMESTSKAAFHWINIEFDGGENPLDSWNKNDLRYLMGEVKMYILYHLFVSSCINHG